MRLVAAELVDSREILPGQWLQSFHAPALAAGSRAGQFVHVRAGDWSGLVLRRPFSFNTVDPATGIVTLHFRTVGRGTDWFTRLRPGDTLDMLGPLGRPFEVDARSRHLLLVAGGLGIAGVRMLADEAIRDGRQVVAPVRRGERARGLPVEPAARRGRVRRRHRRRVDGPPRLRHRAGPRLRGLGRPGLRLRTRPDAPGPGRGSPPDGGSGSAWRKPRPQAGRRQADRRSDRRRPVGRPSCRSRWSRTWAARSAPASAAWS